MDTATFTSIIYIHASGTNAGSIIVSRSHMTLHVCTIHVVLLMS